jgi:rhodanese-related sulfurtransferase
MKVTNTKTLMFLSAFVMAILITTSHEISATEIPRITKEEARELMDNPDVVFLDVRSGSDWRASDIKINGAVHEDSTNLKDWISNYDMKKTYILYCA